LRSVYPLYVAKAERKGRTKAEVDRIILWLTGFSQEELETQTGASGGLRTKGGTLTEWALLSTTASPPAAA
jgi:hypothetical protein